MLERRKTKKGITLIALIITIIVLLILAGVALATLTGEGSIIGNAENAVGQYNNSVIEEQQLLNEIEKYFIEHTNEGEGNPPDPVEPPAPPEVNADGLATENYTIKPDENSNVQITIPAGFAPAILATGTTQSGPGQDGSVASIMPADQWNNITVEDINKGIVVVDHAITYDGGNLTGDVSDFNEYVWVSIPEPSYFDRIAWNGPYYSGQDQDGEHPIADKETQNYYWEDSTTTEYQDMIESVNFFKGFYIGRYESNFNENEIAQSKRNQVVWTDITYSQAIEACNKNTTDNLHLIYGIECDSILNWLIGKATILSKTTGNNKTMEIEDMQDSSSWGNYRNFTENTENNIKQVTGYSEYWKANNIYDLAGNVYEWTQERFSIGNKPTLRGGNYKLDGDYLPVIRRTFSVESGTYEYCGFRISFFIEMNENVNS